MGTACFSSGDCAGTVRGLYGDCTGTVEFSRTVHVSIVRPTGLQRVRGQSAGMCCGVGGRVGGCAGKTWTQLTQRRPAPHTKCKSSRRANVGTLPWAWSLLPPMALPPARGARALQTCYITTAACTAHPEPHANWNCSVAQAAAEKAMASGYITSSSDSIGKRPPPKRPGHTSLINGPQVPSAIWSGCFVRRVPCSPAVP